MLVCWGIFIILYSCFLVSPFIPLDLHYFFISTIILALHILIRLWMLYYIYVTQLLYKSFCRDVWKFFGDMQSPSGMCRNSLETCLPPPWVTGCYITDPCMRLPYMTVACFCDFWGTVEEFKQPFPKEGGGEGKSCRRFPKIEICTR